MVRRVESNVITSIIVYLVRFSRQCSGFGLISFRTVYLLKYLKSHFQRSRILWFSARFGSLVPLFVRSPTPPAHLSSGVNLVLNLWGPWIRAKKISDFSWKIYDKFSMKIVDLSGKNFQWLFRHSQKIPFFTNNCHLQLHFWQIVLFFNRLLSAK